MNNVVTPFLRKRSTSSSDPAAARHRREGWFDEQDVWHEAESEPLANEG
jgi:hypothetical protein